MVEFSAEQSGDEDDYSADDHSGGETETLDRENGTVERHKPCCAQQERTSLGTAKK